MLIFTLISLKNFKELYRICKDGTLITIFVPHFRHDFFFNDPTHVRVITPDSLLLFSKSFNKYCAKNKLSNSPLGLYLDIDFEIVSKNLNPVKHGLSYIRMKMLILMKLVL